jgi:hypothetical protein
VDNGWLADEPIMTARVADQLAWSAGSAESRRDALYIRDAAVRLALGAGVSPEEIAEALGIRPQDVARIAQERAEPVLF